MFSWWEPLICSNAFGFNLLCPLYIYCILCSIKYWKTEKLKTDRTESTFWALQSLRKQARKDSNRLSVQAGKVVWDEGWYSSFCASGFASVSICNSISPDKNSFNRLSVKWHKLVGRLDELMREDIHCWSPQALPQAVFVIFFSPEKIEPSLCPGKMAQAGG